LSPPPLLFALSVDTLTGHMQEVCRQYTCAKEQSQNNRNQRGKYNKSNNTQTKNTASASNLTEFVESASAPSTSSFPTPPNLDWLADTGATFYMTPHRHWVRNYSSLHIPIRLADSSIVYSSGVGTVVFNPVIGGMALQPVEFSRVLHVPLLKNNLFVPFYLTKQENFEIHITSKKMDFRHEVTRFSVLVFTLTTVLIFSVPRNHFLGLLNLSTGSPLSLSLFHSGTVAVVITTLLTSPRCTRMLWTPFVSLA
jgi:hypothetical protein